MPPNNTGTGDGPPSSPVASHGEGVTRRRSTSTGNGGGYSRLVRLMKVALPLAALAIMATVVAWPSLVEPPGGKTTVEAGESELLRPKFYSVDENGQPFSLTAESAHEPEGDTGVVDLVAPAAEMTEVGGTWVTLNSRTGTYDKRTDILHMIGEVHVIRDDGTEYTTPEAYANVKSGDAWGDAPVVGQGPQGEINAEGFRLTERGKTIVFVNQSTANLPPGGGAGAPAPVADPQPAPMAAPMAAPDELPASVPAPPVMAPPDGPPKPSAEPPSGSSEPPPDIAVAPRGTATTPASSLLQSSPLVRPPSPKPEARAETAGFVPPPPRRKPARR